MDWEAIKQQARIVYTRGSQFVVFLLGISYLVACGVAEKPIGPKRYVEFTYYVTQWAPKPTRVTPATYVRER